MELEVSTLPKNILLQWFLLDLMKNGLPCSLFLHMKCIMNINGVHSLLQTDLVAYVLPTSNFLYSFSDFSYAALIASFTNSAYVLILSTVLTFLWLKYCFAARWRCPSIIQPVPVAVVELYAPATGRLLLFFMLFFLLPVLPIGQQLFIFFLRRYILDFRCHRCRFRCTFPIFC